MWQYFWPHTVQGFATSDCRFMLRSQVDGLKIVQKIGRKLIKRPTHSEEIWTHHACKSYCM